MKLRYLLKKYNLSHAVIAEALGLKRINIDRYDNLIERSVNEVLIISKATGIKFSELVGLNDPELKSIDKLKFPNNPKEDSSLIISTQLKTINALEQTIKSKDELIEMLKNKGK